MKALFSRFYAMTGLLGLFDILLVAIAVLTLGSTVFIWSNSSNSSAFVTLLWTVGAMAAALVAALKYRRSSRTRPWNEVLPPLLDSGRTYCVVLRPFGWDGRIILPRTRGRRVARIGPFTLNVTLEQVVATAVHMGVGLETYGIVDQNTSFAPPGVVFMRASNEEWKQVARDLIAHAQSIVLILPGREVGEGFTWEIEQIVQRGMQSRVILVLPPPAKNGKVHRQALDQASLVLALLEGLGMEAALSRAHGLTQGRLPTDTCMVKAGTMQVGAHPWFLNPALNKRGRPRWRRRVAADVTYREPLIEALKEIQFEISR